MVYSDKQQKNSGGIVVQEEAAKNSDENVDDDIDIEAIWSSEKVVPMLTLLKLLEHAFIVYPLTDWVFVC